ncbi:reverse transcriptase-like protein [Aquibacillus salsiterrae]|uniref:Reverse transcriptase-like protein n=1 Tax=Aquibacillus salsiterrae TaxID=2950439 RepID=A0A9X3WF60_9BACI|nr:reverse transcriptase-like protein [Aquibacillus salsiterrae]MDC3417321.1 reverse transcriptase-like protein [Aquibacillus salsiterrae]
MNVRIEFTYKTKKGLQINATSEEIKAEEAILIAEDMERTGRVGQLTCISTHDENVWTIKELKKILAGIQTDPHNVTVYFDGGFEIEKKKSGLGCVIYYEQNNKKYRLRKNALVEQLNTNNEAEYAALYLALQELELLGVHHLPVSIVGDSQVVINQLEGEWPCVEEELNRWADRIEDKMEQLGLVAEYRSVSRKKNREADQLASQALNQVEIISTIELEEKA